MEDEPIIPTRRKAKTPQTLSYPIGAKAIFEALIGVPQFDQLSVEFRLLKTAHSNTLSGIGLPTDQFARLPGGIVISSRYRVLKAEFSGPTRIFSPSKSMAGQGYYSPSWAVVVEAVPRSLRHRIQNKIVEEALPRIRSWLLANPHSSDEGAHRLVFMFDELENELTSEEISAIEFRTARADRRQ